MTKANITRSILFPTTIIESISLSGTFSWFKVSNTVSFWETWSGWLLTKDGEIKVYNYNKNQFDIFT